MIKYFLQSLDQMLPTLPDSLPTPNVMDALQKLSTMDFADLTSQIVSGAFSIVVKIVVALLIYTVGRFVINRLVKFLSMAFKHRNVDESLAQFLSTITRVVLTIILVLIVVQTLGVNITSILALFASAALAVGMALSGTAQNFAGGVTILLLKPYKVGDFITAENHTGTVLEIKLFMTLIRTPEMQDVYIPNNTISTSIVENYTTSGLRRADWKISISYGDDVAVARQVMLDMLKMDKRVVASPAAYVAVEELADASVNIVGRAWIHPNDYWDVYYEYYEKFYVELPKHGIKFPFPQLDVTIKSSN